MTFQEKSKNQRIPPPAAILECSLEASKLQLLLTFVSAARPNEFLTDGVNVPNAHGRTRTCQILEKDFKPEWKNRFLVVEPALKATLEANGITLTELSRNGLLCIATKNLSSAMYGDNQIIQRETTDGKVVFTGRKDSMLIFEPLADHSTRHESSPFMMIPSGGGFRPVDLGGGLPPTEQGFFRVIDLRDEEALKANTGAVYDMIVGGLCDIGGGPVFYPVLLDTRRLKSLCEAQQIRAGDPAPILRQREIEIARKALDEGPKDRHVVLKKVGDEFHLKFRKADSYAVATALGRVMHKDIFEIMPAKGSDEITICPTDADVVTMLNEVAAETHESRLWCIGYALTATYHNVTLTKQGENYIVRSEDDEIIEDAVELLSILTGEAKSSFITEPGVLEIKSPPADLKATLDKTILEVHGDSIAKIIEELGYDYGSHVNQYIKGNSGSFKIRFLTDGQDSAERENDIKNRDELLKLICDPPAGTKPESVKMTNHGLEIKDPSEFVQNVLDECLTKFRGRRIRELEHCFVKMSDNLYAPIIKSDDDVFNITFSVNRENWSRQKIKLLLRGLIQSDADILHTGESTIRVQKVQSDLSDSFDRLITFNRNQLLKELNMILHPEEWMNKAAPSVAKVGTDYKIIIDQDEKSYANGLLLSERLSILTAAPVVPSEVEGKKKQKQIQLIVKNPPEDLKRALEAAAES